MILKGNIIHAPRLGELTLAENGYLLLDEEGTIRGIFDELPPQAKNEPVCDFGDKLILQSFADMHLHAPQYPQLGMGMDLPLLEWLNTYTFPTEARFADPGFARETYAKLAAELIANGTTRVAMFSPMRHSF